MQAWFGSLSSGCSSTFESLDLYKMNVESQVKAIRLVSFEINDANSVSKFGYYEDANDYSMEDNQFACDNFPTEGFGLFGILDGHGGPQVSEYCKKALPKIFSAEIAKTPTMVERAFERTFSHIDFEVQEFGQEQGCTCCVAYIRTENSERFCYVANLGDTRAVLCERAVSRRISFDHVASDPLQIDRIKKEGGILFRNRVGGSLAVSRALGDLALKSIGVSNRPHVVKFPIAPQTGFLIIASDGVWDVCEDQQAVHICSQFTNPGEMAKALVQKAVAKGSADNISSLVIVF